MWRDEQDLWISVQNTQVRLCLVLGTYQSYTSSSGQMNGTFKGCLWRVCGSRSTRSRYVISSYLWSDRVLPDSEQFSHYQRCVWVMKTYEVPWGRVPADYSRLNRIEGAEHGLIAAHVQTLMLSELTSLSLHYHNLLYLGHRRMARHTS